MKKRQWVSKIVTLVLLSVIFGVSIKAYLGYRNFIEQNNILRRMVARLEADSRIAEVLVTDVQFNPVTQKHMTTIKFLEYGAAGEPLDPKYFTFAGNIIQFQSLVVRFADVHVANGDALRGKSAYLFWKVFVLDGQNTQKYDIAKVNAVPHGYKIEGGPNALENAVWEAFWDYALDLKKAGRLGIKNAQIEAPGTKFVLGILYTIRIEHDGGIRIDAAPIPGVLKGEKIR